MLLHACVSSSAQGSIPPLRDKTGWIQEFQCIIQRQIKDKRVTTILNRSLPLAYTSSAHLIIQCLCPSLLAPEVLYKERDHFTHQSNAASSGAEPGSCLFGCKVITEIILTSPLFSLFFFTTSSSTGSEETYPFHIPRVTALKL